MSSHGLLTIYILALVLVAIVHGTVTVRVMLWIYQQIITMHDEDMVILQAVKDWANIARIQHKETSQEIKQAAVAAEEPAKLAAQVAKSMTEQLQAVPERTASAVVKKLHSSDSGVNLGGGDG